MSGLHIKCSLCEKMEHVVSVIFSCPKLRIHPTTFSKVLEELRSIHVTKKTWCEVFH